MTERRTLWLLLALVVGQLLALTAQVPEADGGHSFLEASLLRAVAPVGVVARDFSGFVAGVGERLRTRSEVLEENARLREEVLGLRERAIAALSIEQDLLRLTEAVDFSRTRHEPLLVADVLLLDHSSWLQTMLLAVAEGTVEHNQPVLSADGLLGRVIVGTGRYAKVQLVTDRSASVGAMIERTRRQGLVRGRGHGGLALELIPLQDDVRVGDLIVTAGIDGVYPRGIPVGTVTSVEPGQQLFHEIQLTPTVDLDRLDQAYVLGIHPLSAEERAVEDGETP